MVEVKEFHKMPICISGGIFELLDTKAFERTASRVNSYHRLHVLYPHHLHCDIVLIGVKQAQTEVFLLIWLNWQYSVDVGVVNIFDIDFNYLWRGTYSWNDSRITISDLKHFNFGSVYQTQCFDYAWKVLYTCNLCNKDASLIFSNKDSILRCLDVHNL